MIEITNKEKCCGCSACCQVCPKRCIRMIQDNEGFLYPSVDTTLCINCGLCEKSCPIINNRQGGNPKELIAAINKDEKIRKESSSGGVFSHLAYNVIKQGGVIFAARFDDNWQVVIDSTDSLEEINRFRGSKYVQASVGNNYARCKSLLDEGRYVMFCGTPCQISGLLYFLHKTYPNLLTVDFVCHGVPSPLVWSKYIDELQNLIKLHKTNIFTFTTTYHNGTLSLKSPYRENYYMKAFLSNLTLRPSCYACPVKCGSSGSDITIADFWGIENVEPSMDDDKGTSLVVINSDKGKCAFELDGLKQKAIKIDALASNKAYSISSKLHPQRKEFFKNLDKGWSLSKSLNLIFRPPFKQQVKANVKKLISQLLSDKKYKSISNGEKEMLKSKSLLLSDVSFRDKQNGWRNYQLRLDFKPQD